jgi:hypothetical protein
MPDAPVAAFHLVPTELFGTLALPADPLARPPDALILARVSELMHRANAAATLRAYRTGWAQWCAYCAEHGHSPLAGRPEPVSFFLAHLSRTKRLATVRSRLAAIAAAHRVAGIELDTRHRFMGSADDLFKTARLAVRWPEQMPNPGIPDANCLSAQFWNRFLND